VRVEKVRSEKKSPGSRKRNKADDVTSVERFGFWLGDHKRKKGQKPKADGGHSDRLIYNRRHVH